LPLRQSRAFGVGHAAFGVSQYEDPVPDMRGTNGGRRYTVPLRIKPERGQRSEYVWKPPSKQRCDVFQHNVFWFQRANNAHSFVEQTASFAIKTGPVSGVANVLAWKTADHAIDSPIGSVPLWEGENVAVSSDIWPVFGEDSLAIGVVFNLPPTFHSGPFKANVKPADPGEQTSKGQWLHHPITPMT
jgi:hypothetical protein